LCEVEPCPGRKIPTETLQIFPTQQASPLDSSAASQPYHSDPGKQIEFEECKEELENTMEDMLARNFALHLLIPLVSESFIITPCELYNGKAQ
jgi:hypothetical protein